MIHYEKVPLKGSLLLEEIENLKTEKSTDSLEEETHENDNTENDNTVKDNSTHSVEQHQENSSDQPQKTLDIYLELSQDSLLEINLKTSQGSSFDEVSSNNLQEEILAKDLVICDIKRYLRKDGTVDAAIFIENFKKQINFNFDTLNLNTMRHWRTCMKSISVSLEQLRDRAPHIFSFNNDKLLLQKIESFHDHSEQFKQILIEESELLSDHLQFVETVLENLHLDSFSTTSINI